MDASPNFRVDLSRHAFDFEPTGDTSFCASLEKPDPPQEFNRASYQEWKKQMGINQEDVDSQTSKSKKSEAKTV